MSAKRASIWFVKSYLHSAHRFLNCGCLRHIIIKWKEQGTTINLQRDGHPSELMEQARRALDTTV